MKYFVLFFMTANGILFGQSCNRCTSPTIAERINTWILNVNETGRINDYQCEYKATGTTIAEYGPVAIAISGQLGFTSKKTTFGNSITASVSDYVSPLQRFEMIAGHGAGLSFEGCKSCVSTLADHPPCENEFSGWITSAFPGYEQIDPCDDPNPEEEPDTSPLIIDLDGDGFHFGGPETGLWYNLHGLDYLINIQWVRPNEDDAFLAMDHNGNGTVDDGSELFGNGTRMLIGDRELALNGFLALAQYDDPRLGGNDDGLISASDTAWSALYLWLDHNADGNSTPDEMTPIQETQFRYFATIPKERKHRDEYGNRLRFWADAQTGGIAGRPHRMVDVFFKLLSKEKVYLNRRGGSHP